MSIYKTIISLLRLQDMRSFAGTYKKTSLVVEMINAGLGGNKESGSASNFQQIRILCSFPKTMLINT